MRKLPHGTLFLVIETVDGSEWTIWLDASVNGLRTRVWETVSDNPDDFQTDPEFLEALRKHGKRGFVYRNDGSMGNIKKALTLFRPTPVPRDNDGDLAKYLLKAKIHKHG